MEQKSIFQKNNLQMVKGWNNTKVSVINASEHNDDIYKDVKKQLDNMTSFDCLQEYFDADKNSRVLFFQNLPIKASLSVELYEQFMYKVIESTSPLQMSTAGRNFYNTFFESDKAENPKFIWKKDKIITLHTDNLYNFVQQIKFNINE